MSDTSSGGPGAPGIESAIVRAQLERAVGNVPADLRLPEDTPSRRSAEQRPSGTEHFQLPVSHCCAQRCCGTKVTLEQCITTHKKAAAMAWDMRRTFVTSNMPKDKGRYQYRIDGAVVCKALFLAVYNVNEATASRWATEARNSVQPPGPLKRPRAPEDRERYLIAFLQELESNLDQMPNSDKTRLPSGFTWKNLYEKYVAACGALVGHNAVPYTYPHFLKLQRQHFPHFALARETEFTQCGLCKSLKPLRDSAILTDPQRAAVQDLYTNHLDRVNKERQLGASREMLATVHPNQVMHIAIDTMTQTATMIPRMVGRATQATAQLPRLPASITLARVQAAFDYFNINNGAFPKDSNYICSVLLKVLLEEAKRRSAWPSILFLQLDNATGENKNHYVKGLLALLVSLGIFTKIYVVYFPVGHTHAGWDRRFSYIMKLLRARIIITQEDLEQAILESAFGATDPTPVIIRVLDVAMPVVPETDSAARVEVPDVAGEETEDDDSDVPPLAADHMDESEDALLTVPDGEAATSAQQQTSFEQVRILPEVLNVRDYLKPFLNPVHHISKPHIFLLEADSAGETRMYCKTWATSQDPWFPKDGHVLLKPGLDPSAVPLVHPFAKSGSSSERTPLPAEGCNAAEETEIMLDAHGAVAALGQVDLLDQVRSEVAEVVKENASRQSSAVQQRGLPTDYHAVLNALASWKPILRAHTLDNPEADGKLAELEAHVRRIIALCEVPRPLVPPTATLLTDLISTVEQLRARAAEAGQNPRTITDNELDKIVKEIVGDKVTAGVFQPPQAKRIKRNEELKPGELAAFTSPTPGVVWIGTLVHMLSTDKVVVKELNMLGDKHPDVVTETAKCTHVYVHWYKASTNDNSKSWPKAAWTRVTGKYAKAIAHVSSILYSGFTFVGKPSKLSAKTASDIQFLMNTIPRIDDDGQQAQ